MLAPRPPSALGLLGSGALVAIILTLVPRFGFAGCSGGDFAGCTAQCDGGDPDSCSNLGSIYRDGTVGVPRDEARANELYRKACTRGSTDGCTNLQTMYREGRGFSKKPRK